MTGLRNFVLALEVPLTSSRLMLNTEEVIAYPLGAAGAASALDGVYVTYPVPVGADPGISTVTAPSGDAIDELIPEA